MIILAPPEAKIIDRNVGNCSDIRKIQTLTAFSKVDELKSSSSEFQNLQQFINQESSKDYISEKKTLGKALSKIAQPSLADAF